VKLLVLLFLLVTSVQLLVPLMSQPFPMVLVALEMTAQATQMAQKHSYRPILKATGCLRLKIPGVCADITDCDESKYWCCGEKRPKTGTRARKKKRGE